MFADLFGLLLKLAILIYVLYGVVRENHWEKILLRVKFLPTTMRTLLCAARIFIMQATHLKFSLPVDLAEIRRRCGRRAKRSASRESRWRRECRRRTS